MEIRQETIADVEAIRNVNRRAFAQDPVKMQGVSGLAKYRDEFSNV